MSEFTNWVRYGSPNIPPPIPGPPGPPPPPLPAPSAADYASQVRRLLDNLDASVGRVMRERDEARAEIARARAATVDAMNEASRQRDNAARSEQYRTWWLKAKEEVERVGNRWSEARQQFQAAEKALRDAEAKTVDIGWRKNRLLDAITAKGYTVEWQKDGTPVLLTREDIAKREEEAKRKDASTLNMSKLADSLRPFYAPGGLYWDYLVNRPGPLIRTLMGLASPDPFSNAKPEDRVVSQQPAKPAERTAEDYYRAAIKTVWGYPVRVEGYRVADHLKVRLDEALKTELRKRMGYSIVCTASECSAPQCRIYHGRPWQ